MTTEPSPTIVIPSELRSRADALGRAIHTVAAELPENPPPATEESPKALEHYLKTTGDDVTAIRNYNRWLLWKSLVEFEESWTAWIKEAMPAQGTVPKTI